MDFVINSEQAKAAAVRHVQNIKVPPVLKEGEKSPFPVQVVKVDDYHRTRSNKQNRAYWKVIIQNLADAKGYEPKHLHWMFKKLYLQPHLLAIEEFVFEDEESTTKLTTIEFMAFVESIRKFAAEHWNIILPEFDSALAMV